MLVPPVQISGGIRLEIKCQISGSIKLETKYAINVASLSHPETILRPLPSQLWVHDKIVFHETGP